MKFLKSLSLLAFAILFLSFNGQSQQSELTEVSPIRAKLEVRNGALLVDVREIDEVAEIAYDVENIINIPLSELKSRLAEIPKDKELIIACRSGKRSRMATNILKENGYINFKNLNGGILSWQEKNLEVISEGTSTKKACCANPNSKDCNPDGTCKKSAKNAVVKKGCCSTGTAAGKACATKKKEN